MAWQDQCLHPARFTPDAKVFCCICSDSKHLPCCLHHSWHVTAWVRGSPSADPATSPLDTRGVASTSPCAGSMLSPSLLEKICKWMEATGHWGCWALGWWAVGRWLWHQRGWCTAGNQESSTVVRENDLPCGLGPHGSLAESLASYSSTRPSIHPAWHHSTGAKPNTKKILSPSSFARWPCDWADALKYLPLKMLWASNELHSKAF